MVIIEMFLSKAAYGAGARVTRGGGWHRDRFAMASSLPLGWVSGPDPRGRLGGGPAVARGLEAVTDDTESQGRWKPWDFGTPHPDGRPESAILTVDSRWQEAIVTFRYTVRYRYVIVSQITGESGVRDE
ncbi:hypothetical protein ACFYVR_08200 [Rhodococcus sp. NPDC003318]|uniref:hypothetical protein n=1 Tax=Rhodococcus sp. NPDC003318 TaxID=3364503 RepID=UPI003673D27F